MIKFFEEYVSMNPKVEFIFKQLKNAIHIQPFSEIESTIKKAFSGATLYIDDIESNLTLDEIDFVYNFLKKKFEKLSVDEISDYLTSLSDFIGSEGIEIETLKDGYWINLSVNKGKIDDYIFIFNELKLLEKRIKCEIEVYMDSSLSIKIVL